MGCHRGDHEKLWHDRFDFVFRVQLHLLGQSDFWEGCPEPPEEDPPPAPSGRHQFSRSRSSGYIYCGGSSSTEIGLLAWLVYKSLDKSSGGQGPKDAAAEEAMAPIDLETVTACLKSFPMQTLLLLEHFDEVEAMYRPSIELDIGRTEAMAVRDALVGKVSSFAHPSSFILMFIVLMYLHPRSWTLRCDSPTAY